MMTLVRNRFDAMGTECSMAVTAPIWAGARARLALEAALAEVAAQELALSRFDPASDLMKLNEDAGDWQPAGDRLYTAVEAAVRARAATGGRYDPTVLPAVIAAGYDTTYTELRRRPVQAPRGWCAAGHIDLDPVERRIRLAEGTSIDLGGIGKGLSATAAVNAMRRSWPEMPGGLVDLGGDIAVTGSAPDRGPWRIDIADPRDHDRRLGTLALASGGVATSGRDRRRLGLRGEGHHLIDPATGRPAAPGPLSVTVVAPSAGEAEAHATALAIMPLDQGAAYLAGRPRLSAIVVPATRPPFTIGRPPLLAWTPGGREVAA